MATESAILTVLPNGYNRAGDRLRVTVFVSPRLSADGDPKVLLKEFASFRDWPSALGNMKFLLEIDGLGTVDLEPDAETLAKPSSDTWRLVFDADSVSVIDGRDKPKDLSESKVNTFPAAQVANQILNLYGEVAATSPTGFPAVSKGPLRRFIDEVGMPWRRKEHFDKLLDDWISQEVKEVGRVGRHGRYLERSLIPPSQKPVMNLLQVDRFYNRPGTRDPMGEDQVPEPPPVPVIDFHGYCAFLGDYPTLLRMLGLAVDLEFEPVGGMPQEGRIRLLLSTTPELDFLQPESVRPWLNYELSEETAGFFPRSRVQEKQGDMHAGSLRLHDDRFALHQIDIDGSAMKAIDYASNMANLATLLQKERSMSKDEASLPALRTGGFVVTRDDRAKSTVGQFDQALLNQAARDDDKPANLFAEDVIRGYRIDVLNVATGRWLSLCARDGEYVVTRDGTATPIEIRPDEGFVKGASTTSVPKEIDPNPVPELYLHEALVGWDGWSLVAKRPGNPIEDPSAPEGGPPADFPLVTKFEATPGTLPRLRFGTPYRLRARTVDLAGNSVSEKTLPEQQVTDEEPFLRFDPVPSPVALQLRQFTEGESLVRMVIRSTLDVLPGAYVALDRIRTLTGHDTADTAYLSENLRHLAPPKTAVQMAEWHRAFDPAIGENAAQAAIDMQFAVAAKESGSFTDPQPGTVVVNPDPAQTPTDLTTHPKGDPLKPGEYILHVTDDLKLPYLPDVAGVGISFTTLPGAPPTYTHLWTGAWPAFEPIRIRVVDGGETGAPQIPVDWNEGDRLLTVSLNQAEMVTVRVSSLMPAGWEAYMGIWSLLSAADRNSQRARANLGLTWMLTPYFELTLVHAVEKPLKPPSVNVASISRNKGETFAVLGGDIANHAKSTGRLDVEAAWTEPIDDPLKDAPEELASQGHVADFLLQATEQACRTGRDDVPATGAAAPVHKVRHEFGDTKHRWVNYHAVATTRFREYFPPEITENPDLIRHAGPQSLHSVPSSRRPDPPEVLYVVPTFTWVDEPIIGLPLGLPVADLPSRISRVIQQARPEIRRQIELQPERAELILPEIKPLLPELRVLPRIRRTRKAGLRVYLDRPWYSSGADELLAVVVPNQRHLLAHVDIQNGLQVDATVLQGAERLASQILDNRIFRIERGAGTAAEQVVKAVQAMEVAQGVEQVASLNLALGRIFEFLPQGDPEKFVTRWGKDPIWGSDAPATGPWIHQFPLRHRVGTDLELSEAPGNKVAAIGHLPEFDPVRKLWFCDIDINAGNSYFPMVKLALARYQPYSIDGVHLSRVVVPEWAQLAAKRTVSVTSLSNGRVNVSLRGPGGYTDFAERSLGPQAGGGPEGMAMSRFAVAHFERLPAVAATDLAWQQAGDQVHLKLEMPAPYSDIRYFGILPVPEVGEGQELRLVVREYEIMEADASQAELDEGEIRILAFVRPPLRYRLVYADYLKVP